MKDIHVIMIDNYDSFTFNCVEALERCHAQVTVFRHHVPVQQLADYLEFLPGLKCLVLSPGPGRPEESGYCLEYVKAFANKLPIFGICLGHQVLAQAFGGEVYQGSPVHGERSTVTHNGDVLFNKVPKVFQAGRYHSLSVTVPPNFTVTASCDDLVMAMRHQTLPLFGLQFHPESILTESGDTLIQNMMAITRLEEEKRYAA